jgi:HTH-type transcriptional regulator/antitoxin HigA
MGQRRLSPHDLIPFIGGRNRVYEVLARKRPLTLKMIWRLHDGLGIPAESLIKGGQRQAA